MDNIFYVLQAYVCRSTGNMEKTFSSHGMAILQKGHVRDPSQQ